MRAGALRSRRNDGSTQKSGGGERNASKDDG